MKNDASMDELPFMSIAPSTLFPGRLTLQPWEVAKAIGCTKEQVINLIEIGKLGAIDIGSGASKQVRRGRHCAAARRFWRIPVSAYERYLKKNNSDAICGCEPQGPSGTDRR